MMLTNFKQVSLNFSVNLFITLVKSHQSFGLGISLLSIDHLIIFLDKTVTQFVVVCCTTKKRESTTCSSFVT